MENSIEEQLKDSSSARPEAVPWWKQAAPRLSVTDSDAHITSVICKNFGLGVQMTCFLSPTRIVLEAFTDYEKEEYKKR
jgi:hypothetical protein